VNVESVPLYSISSFECTPVQQQTRKLFLYIIIVPKIGKAVNQWITGKMEKHYRKKKIWNGMPMFNVAICFLGLGCFVYFLFCFSFSRMLERSGVSVFHLFGFACVKLGLCTVGTWKRSS